MKQRVVSDGEKIKKCKFPCPEAARWARTVFGSIHYRSLKVVLVGQRGTGRGTWRKVVKRYKLPVTRHLSPRGVVYSNTAVYTVRAVVQSEPQELSSQGKIVFSFCISVRG